MDITLEWEGIKGIIKILLLFSVPLGIGFIIGRKTKLTFATVIFVSVAILLLILVVLANGNDILKLF